MRAIRCLVLIGGMLSASCGHETDGPTPVQGVAPAVDPQAVCVEQIDSKVTVSGTGMSPLPKDVMNNPYLALPGVSLVPSQDLLGAAMTGSPVAIPDDPRNPTTSHVRWIDQQQMIFDVYPDLKLQTGLYTVRIANANGHAGEWKDALLGVPRPTTQKIVPDVLCTGKASTFTIRGTFIRNGTTLPTVEATAKGAATPVKLTPSGLDKCTKLPGTSGLESCTELTVALEAGTLPITQGELYTNYTILVRNPSPVQCWSTDTLVLTMVPPATLEKIEPEVVCTAQGQNALKLTGRGFLNVDGKGPTVIFTGPTTKSYTTTAVGCTKVVGPVNESSVELCTELDLTLAKDDLKEGSYTISVQNPAPADCVSTTSLAFAVVPPPKLTAIKPASICQEATTPQTFVLEGTGFLSITAATGTSNPTVTVAGKDFAGTPAGCTTIAGLVAKVQTCTQLSFTIPPGTLTTLGSYDVTVKNPKPADCSSAVADGVKLTVAPKPTLTGVVPSKLCVGGGSIVLTGTSFSEGATVTVNGVPAAQVKVDSSTQITATFSAGTLSEGGPYDVSVGSAGCSVTLAAAVTVTPGPQLFFADPPVVYDGITTQVTLYGSGISGSVTVAMVSSTGVSTTLNAAPSATNPNRILVTVPVNTAAGEYDLQLQDSTSCPAVLAKAFKVVDQITLNLTKLVPGFGHNAKSTAVTAYSDGTTGGGLKAVPRLYLNAAAGTQATGLQAVAFLDAAHVTAVVPKGLPEGTYDLIAVNPDGGVGLLKNAFKAMAVAPPTIAGLSPESISSQNPVSVTVTGQSFGGGAVVQLRCFTAGSTTEADVSPAITGSGATSITFTADPAALCSTGAACLVPNTICVVRVTNADGSFDEISSLVVTNPSQKLSAFVNGPSLTTGRRALVAAAARVNNAARFLYAIGGDDGATTPVLFDSVEVAPVDLYGTPSAFFTQTYKLATPRAFAGGAVVGRCIYVAGGSDGTSALDTIERACLLSPDDRPEILDLDLKVVTTGGLGNGLWYYQVSAVMPATHASNPNGETLPSEPFPLQLPTLTGGKKLNVTLAWSPIPGAVGYKIYRSPAAGAAANALGLITTIGSGATTSYTDAGDTADPQKTVLRQGSTGTWHAVAGLKLSAPRQGPGVAALPDPGDATGTKFFLYVIGGKNGGTALTTHDFAIVTVAADGSQTVSAMSAGLAVLPTGRWQLGLYPAWAGDTSIIPAGTAYVYAGGGLAANGTTLVSDVDAFPVTPGTGMLGASSSEKSMSPASAGYGAAIAANFLYSFGGQNGVPNTNVKQSNLTTPLPSLVNWSNSATSMSTPRYLLGSAIQSGFIYLVGGQTGTNTVTNTIEYTIW
jgi:hypothetical protein